LRISNFWGVPDILRKQHLCSLSFFKKISFFNICISYPFINIFMFILFTSKNICKEEIFFLHCKLMKFQSNVRIPETVWSWHLVLYSATHLQQLLMWNKTKFLCCSRRWIQQQSCKCSKLLQQTVVWELKSNPVVSLRIITITQYTQSDTSKHTK
jgi:hypothetical protein